MDRNICGSTSIDSITNRINELVSADSSSKDFWPQILVLLIEIRDVMRDFNRPRIAPSHDVAGPSGCNDVTSRTSASKSSWQKPPGGSKRELGNTAMREGSGASSFKQANSAKSANTHAANINSTRDLKANKNSSAHAARLDDAATSTNINSPPAVNKVKYNYISKDVAEAEDEIIIVMTNSKLQQTMPGTRSLAKKYGSPVRATGLDLEIGSILINPTQNGKQIWYLVSKYYSSDKLQMNANYFYKNHELALRSLRSKLVEQKIKKVSISRLGAGYLGVPWRSTMSTMNRLFSNDEMIFNVHSLPKKSYVTDLDSATYRSTDKDATTQVAQGVAGGCLKQLPLGPDSNPPPQHAPATQVRANGGKIADEGSHNFVSSGTNAAGNKPKKKKASNPRTTVNTPVDELGEIRTEISNLRSSLTTIARESFGALREEFRVDFQNLFRGESDVTSVDKRKIENEVGKLDEQRVEKLGQLLGSPKTPGKTIPPPSSNQSSPSDSQATPSTPESTPNDQLSTPSSPSIPTPTQTGNVTERNNKPSKNSIRSLFVRSK